MTVNNMAARLSNKPTVLQTTSVGDVPDQNETILHINNSRIKHSIPVKHGGVSPHIVKGAHHALSLLPKQVSDEITRRGIKVNLAHHTSDNLLQPGDGEINHDTHEINYVAPREGHPIDLEHGAFLTIGHELGHVLRDLYPSPQHERKMRQAVKDEGIFGQAGIDVSKYDPEVLHWENTSQLTSGLLNYMKQHKKEQGDFGASVAEFCNKLYRAKPDTAKSYYRWWQFLLKKVGATHG